MNFQRILVATDLSPLSQAALPMATSLARDSGATLIFVYVVEPSLELFAEGRLPDPDAAVAVETAKHEIEKIAPSDTKIPCERHVLIGPPAAEIVEFARTNKIDLIVISTHGRRGLSHLLMGSVAEAVVRRAPCPVMTIKAAPPALG